VGRASAADSASMPANDRIFFHRVTPGAPTKLFTVQRC